VIEVGINGIFRNADDVTVVVDQHFVARVRFTAETDDQGHHKQQLEYGFHRSVLPNPTLRFPDVKSVFDGI
jgi:hypothetical protein